MLNALGIPELAGDVYRLLVTTASATVAELATRLNVSTDAADSAVFELERLGLVTRTATRPARFIAAPPDTVVEGLLLRRQSELNSARAELDELVRVYRDGRQARASDEVIEIVTGQEAVTRRVRQIQAGVREEFAMFVKPPYVAQGVNEAEPLMDPNVHYRNVHELSVLEYPNYVSLMAQSVAEHEENRLHPALPIKLMIADRRIALLPLARGDFSASTTSSVVVHASGLLDALLALFERYWAESMPLPLDEGGSATGRLSADDQRLLSLMLAGATDRTIARELKVSVRTVQRRVSELMAEAGAHNRIQLGWYAAKQSWLVGPDSAVPDAASLRHGVDAPAP